MRISQTQGTKCRNRHDTVALRSQIRRSLCPENWLNRTRATSAMSGAAKRDNLPAGKLMSASLAADRRSKAKTTVKKGEGDRGDQRSD